MRVPARMFFALLLSCTVIAACGGDDSGTKDAAKTNDNATGSSAVSNTVNLGSGGGEFCDKARGQLQGVLNGQNPAIQSLIAGMTDPTKAAEGKAQARAYFEKLKKDNEELISSAPAEIKDTMRTALDATKTIFEALDKVDYDFTKLDVTKLSAITSDPKFSDASKKLQAYFKDTCGFDLGSIGG